MQGVRLRRCDLLRKRRGRGEQKDSHVNGQRGTAQSKISRYQENDMTGVGKLNGPAIWEDGEMHDKKDTRNGRLD